MEFSRTYRGLSEAEVLPQREAYGSNLLALQEKRLWLDVLKEVVTEPMFLLLLAASCIYFLVGQYQEGAIMVVSLFIVAGISLFQEYRSRNAIDALQKMSAQRARVIRDGQEQSIPAEDIVTGDLLVVEEGEIIAADGRIRDARDFSVNESILTGEAYPVYKNAANRDSAYRGTLASSGTALLEVTEVGERTMFGKLGLAIRETAIVKTPLQVQIRSFVRNMVWIGAVAFAIVVTINFLQSRNWVDAFLQGLTLAMSILPEEIPVAFSTFQALGAFRLLKENIIVKQPQYVETLGAATVICADKTGTLTQNRMHLDIVYDAAGHTSLRVKDNAELPAELIEYAMWASETAPFDPMETSIHQLYASVAPVDLRPSFTQVHEYPIGGTPPIMTHIFQDAQGKTVIAGKGAPERILHQSTLDPHEIKRIEEQSLSYAREGYRVLGVGKGSWDSTPWPVSQEEFRFTFLGLLAFQDPPKEGIRETIDAFERAGITVKMITGDYAETALAIARQAGLDHDDHKVITGRDVLQMETADLRTVVQNTNIFARMFPEAKLKVIDALKENGEVVAMTGDGVNDGPALKAAHIGIAMGQRGSEVARSAAALIIRDDNLSHMVDAVALGRKIYDNLRKAVQYIVSIHIPIILIVLLPLLLGWAFHDIFTPVHVIFLELLMGPTCSIIYENEPMESGTMERPPRKIGQTFLSLRQLGTSILQGLAITAACLGMGFLAMQDGSDENRIRSMIFFTLLFSNILLTLVNRSFRYTIFTTIRYKNWLVPLIIGISLVFVLMLLFVAPIRDLFNLVQISASDIGHCLMAAAAGTLWIEPVKALRLYRNPRAGSA
jgi:Ca2+-transporting ATPase